MEEEFSIRDFLDEIELRESLEDDYIDDIDLEDGPLY